MCTPNHHTYKLSDLPNPLLYSVLIKLNRVDFIEGAAGPPVAYNQHQDLDIKYNYNIDRLRAPYFRSERV